MGRWRLIAAAVAVAAMTMAPAAQGHYPYDWEYGVPPAWWAETLGPGALTDPPGSDPQPCVPNEVDVFIGPANQEIFQLIWSYPGNVSGGADCTRDWGPGTVECSALARHEHGGDTATARYYGALMECIVSVHDRNTITCSRLRQVSLWPGVFKDVADSGWVPYDCRPELEGWPDLPLDIALCREAMDKLEKAKKRLHAADSKRERKRAKLKLRIAKHLVEDDC